MPKYVVRYGATRSLGVLSSRGNDRFERGHEVVVRTDRGLERGEVLCLATDDSVQHLSHAAHGQVLRRMSQDDHSEWDRIQTQARQDFESCRNHIRAMNLSMELVDVERLFGGERLIIYYLSEDRVDFRELVKRLAAEFQTRIEMRQIGVRDEAKLLADYGDCGKPLCCNTHLSQMPPVSMKMAKLQKATLDPTKISGRCGRLKCCLRYEYDTYVEMQRELPPAGSDVITRDGRGRVLSQSILAQQLLVEMEDMRRVLIPVADVLTVLPRGQGGLPRGQGSRKESSRPEGGRRERSDRERSEGGRDSSRRESDRARPTGRLREDGPRSGGGSGSSTDTPETRPARGDRPRRDAQQGRGDRGPRGRVGERPPGPASRDDSGPPSPDSGSRPSSQDNPGDQQPPDPAARDQAAHDPPPRLPGRQEGSDPAPPSNRPDPSQDE